MKAVVEKWRETGLSVPPASPGTPRAIGIDPHVALLHELAGRIAAGASFDQLLSDIAESLARAVKSDSCMIYILEEEQLVLRAAKNPHPGAATRLPFKTDSGIDCPAEEPVAIGENAFRHRRFRAFGEFQEGPVEAFLSTPLMARGKIAGVINIHNRLPHNYGEREKALVTTIGFLIASGVEKSRLEGENQQLSEQLETRKLLERAKGILQRDLNIPEEEAYLILQRQSQQRRRPMKEIAEAIVLSHTIKSSSR